MTTNDERRGFFSLRASVENHAKRFQMKMHMLWLKNLGFSYQEIAHKLRIPESTVLDLAKDLEADKKRLKEDNA